jgi:cation transport regulator
MPYDRRADLPEQVKDNLPPHAQDIYRKAFNSAIDQYDGDESRAHRVAWSAVKEKYHKNGDGRWARDDS